MIDPKRQKDQGKDFPEKEKAWENPKNPEATEDSRDEEQLDRQIEEAKRRKDNLTEDND
ncbi:hypothetical protein [Daejeonella sp.]|uniref:hypothetical protein n=1 Tax=Daejeonella sp. TaxID=2805397 RepID=UPI0030C45101